METEYKVTLELAQSEVDSWLDKKKVTPSAREAYKDHIDIMVEAVALGTLTLDDKTNVFTHTLEFPFEDERPLSKISYKPRINDRMLEPYMKGVKAGESDARVLAYLACLTDQPKGILKALDTADSRIARSIVVFFLG